MKVLKGFSEEMTHNTWAKRDVELTSEELEDICIENDISIDKLTLSQKYAILSTEAERLLTIEYIRCVKAHGLPVTETLMDRMTKVALAARQEIEKHAATGYEVN